jgi:hypothetical protein
VLVVRCTRARTSRAPAFHVSASPRHGDVLVMFEELLNSPMIVVILVNLLTAFGVPKSFDWMESILSNLDTVSPCLCRSRLGHFAVASDDNTTLATVSSAWYMDEDQKQVRLLLPWTRGNIVT